MPKRRRGRGDGTVYQRPDGYWVGQINLGWLTGTDGRSTFPQVRGLQCYSALLPNSVG